MCSRDPGSLCTLAPGVFRDRFRVGLQKGCGCSSSVPFCTEAPGKAIDKFRFSKVSRMNVPKISIVCFMLAILTTPLLASTTVNSPTNGQQVSSPFTLNMSANSCYGNPVGAVGYSLDDSTHTSSWVDYRIDGPVTASSGWHTLHVKVWDTYGNICATDVSIDVVTGTASPSSASSGTIYNGGTTISSPTDGQQVPSPFTLNMSASSCDGNQVGAVGYSLDNSSSTSSWTDTSIDGPVTAPSGSHTLHVKVWDDYGDVCVTDVSINVNGGSGGGTGGSGGLSVVPGNAVVASNLQTYGNWQAVNDSGAGGWSSGDSYVTGSPSLSGNSRLFETELNNYGGELFYLNFAGDAPEQNYLYDTWVYLGQDSSGLMNLEFDLNHTMDSGITALMGFQCSGWDNRWEYTINANSPDSPVDQWVKSYAPCDPRNWGADQWHHVQIYFSHDGNGWITYHSVWLDGNEQDLNYSAFSGFALGWAPSIVTNFQIDSSSGGTTWPDVYLDNTTVYRW